jgi:predicted phosphodiesterase
MRIHLLSDLHNEFRPFVPEAVDADVVILAGDIDVKARGVAWAKQAFSCPVLYGGHLNNTLLKMRLASDERVRVLDRDEVIIGGVRFLGATMWTDFTATGNQSVASVQAQHAMNDFRQIRTDNYRRIRPADLVEQSVMTYDWLRSKIAEPYSGLTVMITHHAPTLLSLAGVSHAGTHLDAAYANHWEALMGGSIALWVHGHSHAAVDYNIAGTRVVCNPRGYPGQDTGFISSLVITL